MDEHGNPFHFDGSQAIFARLDRTTARDLEREPRIVALTSRPTPDPTVLMDLVDASIIADQIRSSAECVLIVALAREGITATREQIKRLARELGNNAATTVGFLEVTK
ncbi:MAG: hypothetical protein H0X39_13650 [Actinobacteria bacterium]|nr:hypothetical protein [Actinomycetota bacterium]